MKLMLAAVLGFFIYPAIVDLTEISSHYLDSPQLPARLRVLPSYGIADPFIGNCTSEWGENGHGWRFVLRDYYGCNTLQILISDLLFGKEETK